MENETLRDFLDRREGEIKSAIKNLRAELKELKSAKQALPSGDGDPKPNKPVSKNSEPTIKELCITILESVYPKGLSANSLLDVMAHDHGRNVERASLSPQLSRLKRTGELNLVDGEWFVARESSEPWGPTATEAPSEHVDVDDEWRTKSAPTASSAWDDLDTEVPF